MKYQIQEGTFDVSAEWTDMTTNEFVTDDGDEFNVQVTRNIGVTEGSPSDAMDKVELQMTDLWTPLEILQKDSLTVSGLPACRMEFLGGKGADAVHGMMIIVFHRAGESLVISGASPERVWHKYATDVEHLINSLELDLNTVGE